MVFLSPNPRPMSFWRPDTNETMASSSGWGSYGCCSSSGSVPDFRPVLPPVSAFVPPRRRVERLLRRSSCGFTSQSATYVQLPQLSQCSLS